MNNKINKSDLFDKCRTLHPRVKKYSFLPSTHGTSKKAALCSPSINSEQFQIFKIIQSVFADHSEMPKCLEIEQFTFKNKLIFLKTHPEPKNKSQ